MTIDNLETLVLNEDDFTGSHLSLKRLQRTRGHRFMNVFVPAKFTPFERTNVYQLISGTIHIGGTMNAKIIYY